MGINQLYEAENILITLKAIVTSFLTMVIMSIPFGLSFFIVNSGLMVIGRIIQVLILASYFWVWGFIANRLWDWN